MTISLVPTESFIDPSTNGLDFSSMSLSFQLSLNEISYCITDNSQGKYLAIVSYAFIEKKTIPEFIALIDQLFVQQSLLMNDFSKVMVSFKNNTANLIPKALYDANNLTAYLVFTKEEVSDQCILSDFIKETDAYNVYSLSQRIVNVIQKKFKNAIFIHHSTSYIQSVFKNYLKTEKADYVFTNINNNELEIIIIKQGILQLYNSYPFKMKEDFLYYLLFAMKQFSCDPSSTKVLIMGKIAEQSAIHQLLIKYIADVNFVVNFTPSDLYSLLNEIPEHYYFTLLNMHKCE